MCEFFGVSRAAYYEWLRKLDQVDRDRARMEQVQEAYQTSHGIYGYRRIALWLRQRKGRVINHKAVLRLMKKLGIQSRARRRKAYRKLEELGTYHTYPNVLKRDFMATRPNQKWVTDITYIMTQQGWCYLSTIKDLFDGSVTSPNRMRLVWSLIPCARPCKRKRSLMDLSSTVTRGTNTLRRRIMMSLLRSIALLPPCRAELIVGTMLPWRISLVISRKNTCVTSKIPPLNEHRNSSMTIFTFTTMKGYN